MFVLYELLILSGYSNLLDKCYYVYTGGIFFIDVSSNIFELQPNDFDLLAILTDFNLLVIFCLFPVCYCILALIIFL